MQCKLCICSIFPIRFVNSLDIMQAANTTFEDLLLAELEANGYTGERGKFNLFSSIIIRNPSAINIQIIALWFQAAETRALCSRSVWTVWGICQREVICPWSYSSVCYMLLFSSNLTCQWNTKSTIKCLHTAFSFDFTRFEFQWSCVLLVKVWIYELQIIDLNILLPR